MAEEDFYLSFGSNASTWARSLKNDLRPAYEEIRILNAAIAGLQRNMQGVSGPLAQALTKGLPPSVAPPTPPTGAGGPGRQQAADGMSRLLSSLEKAGQQSNAMMSDIFQASDEMRSVITSMAQAVEGMRAVPGVMNQAIAEIKTSVNGLSTSLSHTIENNINRRPLVNPATGRFAETGFEQGGLVHNFLTQTRQLLNGGGQVGGSLLSVRPGVAPPSISSVSQAAIDQGSVDRIVAAIEVQTRELLAGGGFGGPRTSRAVRTGVQTEEEAVASGEVAPQAKRTLTQARAELAQLDQQLSAAVAGLGEGLDKADHAIIDKVRGLRNDLAAEVARLERTEEGVTRPEQHAARQVAFAQQQQQLEEVTKEEKKARLDRLALIRQAQAPDFLENVGRGSGKYGMSDLKSMAEALSTGGFPIKGVTRKRMDELAQLVQSQAGAYGEQYPTGSYPEALNPRVKVVSGPAISDTLRTFLGEMNHVIEGLRAQRINARTGGDIPRSPGDFTPQNWMVNAPPSTGKGRLGVGGGILDVPSFDWFGSKGLEGRAGRPSSAPTSADLERLRQMTKNPFGALGGVVMGQARNPDWNIYDEGFQTSGKSEEASAARLYLGSLRRATDHLDSLAQAYEDDYRAINENRDFIDRATQRISEGAPKPGDVEKVAAAKNRIEELQTKLAATPEDQLDLFHDQGYQLGRARRDSARALAAARRKQDEEDFSRYDVEQDPLSSYALAESHRRALIGRRYMLNPSGQASKDFISNIPGAVSLPPSDDFKFPRIGREGGMSREDQLALDKALQGYRSATRKAAATISKEDTLGYPLRLGYGEPKRAEGVTPDDVNAAMRKEENAAEKLVNTLSRLFSNQSLTVEKLIGRERENGLTSDRIPSAQGRDKAVDAKIEQVMQGTATEAEKAERAAKAEKQGKSEATAATEQEVAVEKAKTSATKETTAAANAQIAALKKERSDLRAAGPYTRGDAKILDKGASALESDLAGRRGGALRGQVTRAQNKGDADALAAAKARLTAAEQEAAQARELATQARAAADRIKAINAELTALGAGAGSGRGGRGGGGRTAAGGDEIGPGDEGILRQILAELRRITAALKGTIRVTGKNITSEAGGTSGKGTSGTSGTTRSTAARSDTQQEAAALAAIAREREAQTGIERGHQRIEQAEQRLQRIQEQRARVASNAELSEARRLQGIAAAMDQLSAKTKAEIAQLERLHREGASPERITAAQQRVYSGIDKDLYSRNVNAAGRDAAARTVLSNAGPKVDAGQLGEIKRQAELMGMTAAQSAARGATGFFGPQGFWGRIMHTTSTFIVRNFAAGFVFGLTNELQTAIDDAIKTQQTYVRLSSTLESTGKDVGNLRVDLQSLSSNYGVALNDMYDTAAKLAGVFRTPEDLAGGTKTVAMLQQISEGALSADEAVGVLTSIWAAFGDQLEKSGGAEHIADVATSLQNLTGVNIEDTVEGFARISGLAKQMNVSLEEGMTFVSQISRETNQTGAASGEQLQRILEQFQSSGGQSALKQTLGADVFSRNSTRGAVNYGNVLKDLIANWDGLSKAQQDALTHSLAGSRQAAAFNALMDNGTRTLRNLTTATNDQGAAQDRMDQLMKTLNGELARFRSNFQNLVNELVQTGLLDGLGAALHAVNMLLHEFDHLLALLNQLGETNPAVGGLIHMAAALIGAAVAGKVLYASIKGLTGLARGRAEAETAAAGAETVSAATGTAAVGSRAGTAGLTAMEAARAADVKELESALVLSKSMDALTVAYDEDFAASEALVAAKARQLAAINSGTASTAELAAAEQAVTAAEVRHAEAATAVAAAETEAGLASSAGGNAGLLSGAGGLKGIAGKVFSLMKANPEIVGAVATGALILGAEKGQLNRVDQAQSISGGKLPGSGATAAELDASSERFYKAANQISDKLNGGVFGLGVGTGVSRFLDQGIRGNDPYRAAQVNEANQRAIADALHRAATSLDAIEAHNQRVVDRGGTVATPTFASFDSDTLGKQLQSMTDHGRSANQILKDLSDSLFGVGEAARAAKGAFQINGRPTNDLRRWANVATPQGLSILAQQGIDVSNLAPQLRQQLGLEHTVTGLGETPSRTLNLGRLGTRTIPGRFTATTETVRNPRSQYTVKNAAEAMDQTQRFFEKAAAPDANFNLNSFQKRLADLQIRGFSDEAAKYKKIHQALVAYFKKDRNSYQTLLGESELSHKDANTLITDINQYTESALQNLPETDLNGRVQLNQSRVAGIKRAIAKTKGRTPTQFIYDLQNAENALAESQIAELDRTRVAAQAADHSKAGLRAAAERETQAAVRIAIKHGDADLLAQVIQNSGKAGQVLAIAAIRNMQKELDAYKAAENQLAAVAAGANATLAEALQNGLGQAKKPGFGQKVINQLLQAAKVPTGKTKDAPWFTGQDVPGLDSGTKDSQNDASQLRADRQALLQARLGIAAAYADAHGDAVAAAQVQVRIAAAAIAAAKQDMAVAKTQDERLQAQTALYTAEAQMIAAHAAVAQAQADLVSSRFDVAIALAEAAGRTVQAARERAAQARAALSAALRRSGGKNTAEVNQARASAIAAEAAVRDAKLQDELDTINFNLEMGRITQSSAIHALQHILATENLTKAQRRQLLLQIKGMKDELADSQWNFGDIRLPTPYQMRRYIDERRKQFRNEMDAAAAQGATKPGNDHHEPMGSRSVNNVQTTTINIDGADIGMVRKVIKEVVGGNVNIRTTGPRRGR